VIRNLTKKKVGVLMGGLSEERDISLKTGGAVLAALDARGYNAVAIDAGRDLPARIEGAGIEVAFIALHGRYGEDGCVQGLCEVMGVPYTGSGVRASALAMDKAATKRFFASGGIGTPAFRVVSGGEKPVGLTLPVVVKPSQQGSAIGVSIVRSASDMDAAITEAASYGGAVVVEEYIVGRELTVAVLDGAALPIIEIRPEEGFYDYHAKYTAGAAEFVVPAALDTAVEKRVVDESLAAYRLLDCQGAARVDLMLGKGETPYVLEVNTVPGLTELSLFPRAADAAGMDYPALVERILEGAGLGKF
jgi:D-alanine-D-alanine ligase